MRVFAALSLLFATACGAAPYPDPPWPPPLPPRVELEPGEPEVVPDAPSPPDPVLVDDAPLGPEATPGDGDVIEVVEGELDGIRYLEMILGEAADDEPLPTLWILHGRGDRARVPGGPFFELPRPVRVFVPQAPTPVGDGFSWLPHRVAEGRTAELAAALEAMADRLAHLIDHFTRARPMLGRPMVAGFSQGGLLSFAIALRHPEAVERAFPSAGWLPPSSVPDLSEPSRFPPIRALHGTLDERIPVEPTRALVEQLRAAGLDVELVEAEGAGHEMSPAMEAQLRAWLEEALAAPAAPETGLVLSAGPAAGASP